MEAPCGHTPDNNKNALLGVQSVSLVATVSITILYAISAGYAGDGTTLAYLAVLAALGVAKLIGLSLGLAGASRANPSTYRSPKSY